jgi:cysteine desulfurase
VSVDANGQVDLEALAALVGRHTLLVSVMAVNNETGVTARLPEIGEVARRAGALLHTDATQLLAWGPVDVDELGVDLLSMSAHKLHGPVGAGALYVRDEIRHRMAPRAYGGDHEAGLRSGTLNTPGIAGLGVAARLAAVEGPPAALRVARLRDNLAGLLTDSAGPVNVHGGRADRAPGTLNIALLGAPADQVLAGAPDLAASRGSACSGGSERPSHVLTAMGVPVDEIECSMRLSLHRGTTADEIAAAAEILTASAATVRSRHANPNRQLAPVLTGGAAR